MAAPEDSEIPNPMLREVAVFVSYAREDTGHRDRLEKSLIDLGRRYPLTVWCDERVETGDQWETQVFERLGAAQVIALILSADYFASDFCWAEMNEAIARAVAGDAVLIPILARACMWERNPIASFQMTPTASASLIPVTQWPDADEAWMSVANAVESAIKKASAPEAPQVATDTEKGSPPEPQDDSEPSRPRDEPSLLAFEEWTRWAHDINIRFDSAYRRLGRLPRRARQQVFDELRRLRAQLELGPEVWRSAEVQATHGTYRLNKHLAFGSFGSVWKATDLSRNQVVALKLLHPWNLNDQSRLHRFQAGALLQCRLDHPNIVRGLHKPELVTLSGLRSCVFVMEYIEGVDLRRAVLDGATDFTAQDTKRALLDVADALSYLHQADYRRGEWNRPVVHRDVCPHNIMVDLDGRARLTDFDLVYGATHIGSTRYGEQMGTDCYVAPEVREPHTSPTEAADVYSLAVTAIFALLGRTLGTELSASTVAESGLSGVIDRLPCSVGLRQDLRRATKADPAARFHTVGEFRERLTVHDFGNKRATRIVGRALKLAVITGGLVVGGLWGARTLEGYINAGKASTRLIQFWASDAVESRTPYSRIGELLKTQRIVVDGTTRQVDLFGGESDVNLEGVLRHKNAVGLIQHDSFVRPDSLSLVKRMGQPMVLVPNFYVEYLHILINCSRVVSCPDRPYLSSCRRLEGEQLEDCRREVALTVAAIDSAASDRLIYLGQSGGSASFFLGALLRARLDLLQDRRTLTAGALHIGEAIDQVSSGKIGIAVFFAGAPITPLVERVSELHTESIRLIGVDPDDVEEIAASIAGKASSIHGILGPVFFPVVLGAEYGLTPVDAVGVHAVVVANPEFPCELRGPVLAALEQISQTAELDGMFRGARPRWQQIAAAADCPR